MDSQTLFNGILAVSIAMIGGLGGFVLKSVWDALKDLQRADMTLINKVHSLETEISNEYVKREEFCKVTDQLFLKLDMMADRFSTKLDTLLARVDTKISKSDCRECVVSLNHRRRATDHQDHYESD